MILLFDQNISYKVPRNIQNIFPGSKYLSDEDISNYSDLQIWEYAKIKDFCLVTFDADFIDITNLKGFPPKVIWLRIGNTSSKILISLFEIHAEAIKEFAPIPFSTENKCL